jgi:hypothetical protein
MNNIEQITRDIGEFRMLGISAAASLMSSTHCSTRGKTYL